MAVIKKDNSFMEFPLQIARQYGAPIDKYSVFYDITAAQTYATTNPLAYVGQIITVVDEANQSAVAYLIKDTSGTLEEVGTGSAAPMLFVTSEAEMLALEDIEIGQQVYREDTHTVWIYKGGTPATLSNWVESASQNDTVWNGTENRVVFYATTAEGYDAIEIKDANTLYFITDAGKIFKGAEDVTAAITVGDTPEVSSAIKGRLYIDPTSLAMQITVDGQTWITMSPGYLTDGANWAAADSNKLATIGLIKAGIQEAVSAIDLTGYAHDVTYDATNMILTIPVKGQSDVVVNIPKDKFVTAGKYYEDYPETNPTHHKVVVLTIENQDEPVIIPAEALVNIYSPNNEGKNVTIEITDDNKISATIQLDPIAGNALTHSENGFKVDVSDKADKIVGATGDRWVLSAADGQLKESEITKQQLVDAIDSSAHVVTEAGVDNLMVFNDSGDIKDSGVNVSDVISAISWQDIAGV